VLPMSRGLVVALLTAPAPKLAELALVDVPVGTGVAHVAIPQMRAALSPMSVTTFGRDILMALFTAPGRPPSKNTLPIS